MFKINLICRRRAVGYQLVMPSAADGGPLTEPTMGHRQRAIWGSMFQRIGSWSYLVSFPVSPDPSE